MLRGVAYRKYQFEVLQGLRKKCLNYFQAIIMTYPISETPESGNYIKFTESLRILQEITQNIIDEARKKVKKAEPGDGLKAYCRLHKLMIDASASVEPTFVTKLFVTEFTLPLILSARVVFALKIAMSFESCKSGVFAVPTA